MKIKKITISNISSYAGTTTFDFEVTPDKSVILIGGQNGTGKTSLFTALKLALYGHLSFNYQSNNGQYFAKVRELINHDAFTTDHVQAYIEVELEMPNDREVNNYTIKRQWDFLAQKISEELTISNSEKILPESEVIFFQNYLYTILPPNMFDFFFFDGEQITEFFASSAYNSYIKNSVLTLCSYDTFEIIRKFCDNYVSSNENSEELNEITSKFESVVNDIEVLEARILINDEKMEQLNNDLIEVNSKKAQLENEFKNSGGLNDEQKEELLGKSREFERVKSENNLRMKSFVEGKMPFIIAGNLAPVISSQLEAEDEAKKYAALQDKLENKQTTKAVDATLKRFNIQSNDNSELADELLRAIAMAVKPEFDDKDFEFIHDLSKEQQEKVNTVLSYVNDFSPRSIIKVISEKEKASKETIEINKQLREAMSDVDTERYSLEINDLINTEFDTQKQIEVLQKEQESDKEILVALISERESTKEQLIQKTKNKNTYKLTGKISTVLDEMISELTKSKFSRIAELTLSILKDIMRKDNFIDLVELDEDFNIYLYKEQKYQHSEIENLINNLGSEELSDRIGTAGVSRLIKAYKIDSISGLKASIKKNANQLGLFDNDLELYKKIELNQLSKGEKQIFILSLYYAIIKVSGKDIPFIIDTPYARIDTEHREQISKVFFPNVSNQVIILSTDEEITLPYYEVLKPFIAKEYVLSYDEKDSKTTVDTGYFFKE